MLVFPQHLFQFVHQRGETLKSIKIQYLGRDLDWDIEHPGILQFLNDIKLQITNLDKLDAVWEFNTFYYPEWTWYKQETDQFVLFECLGLGKTIQDTIDEIRNCDFQRLQEVAWNRLYFWADSDAIRQTILDENLYRRGCCFREGQIEVL